VPELPDVEEFKQYMDATSLHKNIKDAKVSDKQVLEDISPKKLERELKNNRFEFTHRYGKYLFAGLSDGKFLVMHFGMTGFLKYFKNQDKKPEHTRLLVTFTNGYHLAYDNQRKLGKLNLIDDIDRYVKEQGLGPDVMGFDFDFDKFKKAFKGRKAKLKSFLMNQNVMAGIGNIYSDEILFQAGIHPETKANTLSEKQLIELFREMKDVMKKSIEMGPVPHKLPQNFIIPHRNKNDRCPVCGRELKRIKVGGRTSYYCPHCQK
jgi:formamidopyrimidine-DNA glycosylase